MQVILIRHAHAEWPGFHGPDFDRPLTERGLAESRATARAISDAGHRPTLLVASPALRTRQTAELLSEEFQLPDAALYYVETLYNAGPATLEEELRKLAKPGGLTVLVAHNPGISNLARSLANDSAETMLRTAEWRLLSLR
jgi:phosphohistidine phosphatase